LKRTTADLQGIKKEIVPLRLERDALKNEAKKLGSERNLLRHSLERLQREGGAAPIPATSTTAGGSGTDGSADALTTLQGEHAAALASHAAEITRLHDERQEFKKYIDWVRPDREKLKDELKTLRASFEQSEAEKKMLMSEVTRYLAQQQDTKPIISPVMEKAPTAASPTKNGHQQHEQLVQALGIIEQEFTKYRTRVEEELAEGKSAVAQVEMEKSMVEEEFERFRLEQMRAREEWEREVGKYRREVEEKRKVSRSPWGMGSADVS
jgi:chromosome segregation ATPase